MAVTAAEAHASSVRVEKGQKKRQIYAAAETDWSMRIFLALSAAAVVFGWSIRSEEYFTAEEGVGYWLGIVGGVLMVSQLLYSARKSAKFMRNWGRVGRWFSIHKFIGIGAPILILYHSNFGLGSFNSNIALVSMLLVVISGLVGRFIYTKFNYRLFGKQADLDKLKEYMNASREEFNEDRGIPADVVERLHRFDEQIRTIPKGILKKIGHIAFLSIRARVHRFAAKRALRAALKVKAAEKSWSKAEYRRRLREGKLHVDAYMICVRRVVEFSAYTRLFAVWHVVHVPFLIMMYIAGVVHVVAVHMY